MRWTPEKVSELQRLMDNGHSWQSAADTLAALWNTDISWDTVRTAARRNNFGSKLDSAGQMVAPDKYDKPWELDGDWLIAGDTQFPFADWWMVGRIARVAKKYKLKRLLLAGDVFEWYALSSYPSHVPAPPIGSEVRSAKAAMEFWSEWFEDIRIITGNHDQRFFRMLSQTVETDDLLALALQMLQSGRVARWSMYGWCLIKSETGMWRVTHPRNYARNALTTARKIAHKHRQHVISFHEHHTAQGFDDSGDFVIANVGCVADPQKFPYVELVDSTNPRMNQSFATLRKGRLRIFDRHQAWG